MLVLTRYRNEAIVIDLRHLGLGLVTVTVNEVRSTGRVKLGVEADPSIPVNREEIFTQKELRRA